MTSLNLFARLKILVAYTSASPIIYFIKSLFFMILCNLRSLQPGRIFYFIGSNFTKRLSLINELPKIIFLKELEKIAKIKYNGKCQDWNRSSDPCSSICHGYQILINRSYSITINHQ